ncbi:MAG: hypothetical protein ACJAY8_001114 [Sphingobacteriales bacterium]|jgi:hypothetical protein
MKSKPKVNHNYTMILGWEILLIALLFPSCTQFSAILDTGNKGFYSLGSDVLATDNHEVFGEYSSDTLRGNYSRLIIHKNKGVVYETHNCGGVQKAFGKGAFNNNVLRIQIDSTMQEGIMDLIHNRNNQTWNQDKQEMEFYYSEGKLFMKMESGRYSMMEPLIKQISLPTKL